MIEKAPTLRGATVLGGATVTIRLHADSDLDAVLRRIERQLRSGLRFIELRDDLLDDEQLLWLAARLPSDQRLLSLRRRSNRDTLALIESVRPALLDYALELGRTPILDALCTRPQPHRQVILSTHTRTPQESLTAQLDRLSQAYPSPLLLKAALPIQSLAELWEGHLWHLQSPLRHLFLPISADGSGRFRFYRLLQGESLLLNFLRDEDAPLIPDQPTWEEWKTRHAVPMPQKPPIPFAAILGDPVEHSRTPAHHQDFFAKLGMPVLKIKIPEEETRSSAVLPILRGLGLRAAAVTSPLKPWLYEVIRERGGRWESASSDSDEAGAGNTLAVTPLGTLIGTSTDGVGLRTAWQSVLRQHAPLLGPDPRLAVFGGGGLLPLLRACFPSALFLSARTAALRDDTERQSAVAALIWSVGRSRYVSPPPPWLRPQLVFDLNYAADSPGRDFAQEISAVYVDGSEFFVAQAAAQQAFWKAHLSTLDEVI